MPQLLTKTAKLLPYAKKAKALPSFATAYDYEPEPGAGLELGSMLVVIEVLTAQKQAEEVADMVIKTVGETYYNQSQQAEEPQDEHDEPEDAPDDDEKPSEEESNDEDAEAVPVKLPPKPIDAYARFEAAIKAVNHQLADYTNQGNAGWVGRLSAVIAVQLNDQLHVTQTGSASGYLYRQGKASNITEDMTSRGPHRPISTFASIASGELEAEDRLLLATPALFHQVSKDELRQIISENGPQGSVAKLSELVNQNNNSDRVAAVITEITTPELLAMQRGAVEEADSVHVGQPDSMVDNVRDAASPVVAKGLAGAKNLGYKAAHHAKHRLWPALKSGAITTLHRFGSIVRNPKNRDKLYFAGGALVLLAGWLVYLSVNAQALNKLVARYDNDYTAVNLARDQVAAGDKAAARNSLQATGKDLDGLAALPQSKLLANRLSHRAHPEADPASISELRNQINALINQIDGLATAAPSDVASFESLKNAKPDHFELVAGKMVLVDSTSGQIYVYDPTVNQVKASAAAPVAKVVATTLSSANDGIYILTDEPSVWFYKLDGDTATKQTTSFGDWPKGRAIASYNSNLYILASDSSQIYKQVKTVGGFGGKSAYLATDVASGIASATTLTVDGSVYTAGSFGIKRFVSAKADKSVSLPESLSHPSQLVSILDGDQLLELDSQSNRIGLINSGGANLAFDKQISLPGNPKLLDAKVDSKTKLVYVLENGKLVKFPLP